MKRLCDTLPKYSQEHVSLLKRLGLGKYFFFQSEHGAIKLCLNHAPTLSPTEKSQWCRVDTLLGDFWLEEKQAEPLLSWLSRLPFISSAEDTQEQQAWNHALYQQQLYPEIKNELGLIQVFHGERYNNLSLDNTLHCRFTWLHNKTTQGCCAVILPHKTAKSLLNSPNWLANKASMPPSWPIHHPLEIGKLSLPYKDIMALAVGDVLLPKHCAFSIEGEGEIQLGSYRFEVRATENGTNLAFIITQCEQSHSISERSETPMQDESLELNEEFEPSYEEEYDSPFEEMREHTPPTDSPTISFDHLQTQLSLQAGHITLSLAELQQLQAGQIITVKGEQAGCATLLHGSTPIAHGDLVNVDGQLGLQITQLFFQATPQHQETVE